MRRIWPWALRWTHVSSLNPVTERFGDLLASWRKWGSVFRVWLSCPDSTAIQSSAALWGVEYWDCKERERESQRESQRETERELEKEKRQNRQKKREKDRKREKKTEKERKSGFLWKIVYNNDLIFHVLILWKTRVPLGREQHSRITEKGKEIVSKLESKERKRGKLREIYRNLSCAYGLAVEWQERYSDFWSLTGIFCIECTVVYCSGWHYFVMQ